MEDDAKKGEQPGRVGPGGGFVIGCLMGLFGVVGGIILWLSDASFLVVLLAYLGFPAVLIVGLFVAMRPKDRDKSLKTPEKAPLKTGKSGTAAKKDSRQQPVE
ncbi:hypothetical protein [Salipiger sp. PrR002]|uniref:hypothetical protein n=1 Tax=Salipiger sp. PrR002 TaxID=2706489 RepID=UPI0013B83E49|nr:hypothetical protein [Salipiger sp. PrR002]NDV99939.1 hypothetical protein [Salipiger sp. PrR002]NDW56268.1 hypothetical protein [Salipiger sp. PrR004]